MKQTIFLAIAIILSSYTDAQIKRPGSRRVLIGGGAPAQSATPVISEDRKAGLTIPKQTGVLAAANQPKQNIDILAISSRVKRGNITYYLSKEGSAKGNSYKEIKKDSSAQTDPTNPKRICRSERSDFKAENITQDVLNPEAISDLRLGAVYKYTDLGNGNFRSINGNRNPIYYGITNGVKMIKVEQPTERTLFLGLNELKDITFADCPVGLGQYLETKTVNSVDALNIAIGASYSGFGFNASATFGYIEKNNKSKFILTYLNPVYTVTALPEEDGKLFNNDADNNNPEYVYIDKITYGVRLMVYFETELSETDSKIGFSASGWGGKVDGDIEKKNAADETTYKIYLVGKNIPIKIGTGLKNVVNDVNELLSLIAINGKKRPNELGVPISYSLKFLDGTTAATHCSALNIPSHACGLDPDRALDLEINLTEYLHGGFGVDGNIKAALRIGDNEFNNTMLYTVPSQARIGASTNPVGPVATIKIPSVSKDTRENGVLRLYGIWNSNGDYYMSGVNLATGPFSKNTYYKDIPLKEIIPKSLQDPYRTSLEFRGKNHVLVGSNTETFFIPKITARFIYE